MTLIWENSEAGECVNTLRLLTTSLDPSEEGLALKATHRPFALSAECEPWGGAPHEYQRAAQQSFQDEGHTIMPWTWITPTCGTHFCLTTQEYIEKRYRRVLNRREFAPSELRQMGPILKASIRRGLLERDEVMRRLRWPEDLDYDERAFHRSGIPDPASLGLL